LPPGGGHG